MTLGTSLRDSMRVSIENFGETITHNAIASQTVSTDDEGEKSITFNSSVSIKGLVTDTTELVSLEEHGQETLRTASITVKDNVTVQEQDRFTFNSLNWKVLSIDPVREGGTVVAQTVSVVQDRR